MDTAQLILALTETLLTWLGRPDPDEQKRLRMWVVVVALLIALAVGLAFAWQVATS